jgi:ribonuclease-3
LNISPERKKLLRGFEKTIRITFSKIELLNLAFIHRSVSNETDTKLNNERLEFLGDSVLGLAAASLLYTMYADKNEGGLAKIKSILVSEDVLSGLALQLQIDNLLLLGHGEEQTGGRLKKAILADALEAVIGACYLDQGFPKTFTFLQRLLKPEIEKLCARGTLSDPKTLLQETCQKRYHSYPRYKTLQQAGPQHAKFYRVEVLVNGAIYGPGAGTTKKAAEQEAAKIALESLPQGVL